MTDDRVVIFEKLRTEVCEQFGFDIKALKPWQQTRVHSVVLLKFEQDRNATPSTMAQAPPLIPMRLALRILPRLPA
jgi:hypothetical protein